MTFKISGEYIELIRLLKASGIASSGTEAKKMVEEGNVKRNGQVEVRKRAKIKSGELIEVSGLLIRTE